MEELQKQGLITADTNSKFAQSMAQMAYEAKVQNVAVEEIAGAFNNLETATKQSIYEMMWGTNGWSKFQQAFKNVVKQLIADIVYLTIKMAALQAVMSTTGLGTFGAGGGIVGKVLGKYLKEDIYQHIQKAEYQLPIWIYTTRPFSCVHWYKRSCY